MSALLTERVQRRMATALTEAGAAAVTGSVTGAVGLGLEVEGVEAGVGDVVQIERAGEPLAAEVVALRRGGLLCLPVGDAAGIAAGARVRLRPGALDVPVGPQLLGRVLDGLGRPLDGGPALDGLPHVGVGGAGPHPLRRERVDVPLSLGVRALDTLTPVARGQRLGLMAGSGVGKSSLLSMIARGSEAEVTVLALIGERGREVREFLEDDLGPEGLARSVVVVATGDQPALVRLRAALTATRIAESFRDRGSHVLLMMDSLTRVAMAQREIGLSAGEPPATRGYPPSVFSLIPRLLERAGTAETGSITGLYTVLVEGDDLQDPVGDCARSVLDGHVVLSRNLATAGHFPSIDALESISRVASRITDPAQRAAATEFRRLLAAYRDGKDLVDIGAYAAGADPLLDRALQLRPAMLAFLQQAMDDTTPAAQGWARLIEVIS